MKYSLVIVGVIKKSKSHSRYSIILNDKIIWLSWKSFTYLCMLAEHVKGIRYAWTHRDTLEPQNVARHIHMLRKEIGVPDLIESYRAGGVGYYRINPDCTVIVTATALELVEEG